MGRTDPLGRNVAQWSERVPRSPATLVPGECHTDFDDIIFLIQQNLISLNELERIMRDALPHARKYDFHPDILDHLKELKNRIG